MGQYPKLVLQLLRVMVGSTDGLEGLANNPIEHLLVAVYVFFGAVMLFNTLVAAMNDTFRRCVDNSEALWKLERVRIIASIESEMNTCDTRHVKFWVERPAEIAIQIAHDAKKNDENLKVTSTNALDLETSLVINEEEEVKVS